MINSSLAPHRRVRYAGGFSGRAIIAQADVAYDGKYILKATAFTFNDFYYSQGLTHRVVGGQVSFFIAAYDSGVWRLTEFNKPASLNTDVTSTLRVWSDSAIWQATETSKWLGMYWDEANQRLMTTCGEEYPQDHGVTPESIFRTKVIKTMTLNSNGTISNVRGPFGLQNVGGRGHYGGFVEVPAQFQSDYSVGPYAVGFGGYASRGSSGGGVALGPNLFAIPEPTSISDDTEFTSAQWKALSDYRAGFVIPDWWTPPSPGGPSIPARTFDRGRRNSALTNTFDRDISQTPNVDYWTSPAPAGPNPGEDGLARWTWGDSPYGGGVWIDGPSKHGFVLIPTFNNGLCRYNISSALESEYRTAEIQVFDPAHLGQVKLGTRQPYNLTPTSRWEITDVLENNCTSALYGMQGSAGNQPNGGVVAATFNLALKKLWILVTGTGPATGDATILQFSVEC